MFNKLKQQFAHINNPKKRKAPFEEEKGFEIDLNNLWKYSSQELQGFIALYEKYGEKINKHYNELNEEFLSMKEKLGVLETEKSQILTEKMQFKLQVDNICNILTSETLLKEKFKLELENTEKTKENDLKVKKDLQTKLSKLEALIKERNLEENEIFKDFLNELDSFKSVFEGLNPPYKEEYSVLLQNLDKAEKINKELESDLLKMSEKMRFIKQENLSLSTSLNELKTKIKAEEIKASNLSLENQSLTESNDLIKDKISFVLNEKTKLEEASSNGTRDLKLLYEGSKEKVERLEESLKQKEEGFLVIQRDLENKLIQERLKYDQKARDFNKLEEQYTQGKSDLLTQIEGYNKAMEKLQLQDLKLSNDKRQFKEEKKKYKSLRKELLESQTLYNKERELWDIRIKELEGELKKLIEQIQGLEEDRQNYLNKDLELKSQDLKLQELLQEKLLLQESLKKASDKADLLEVEALTQKTLLQTLHDKREASLHEIQRLSNELQGLKSMRKEVNTPLELNNREKGQKREGGFLCRTKKELEGVYREMIEGLLPLVGTLELNKAFVKIEKKLNDAIRRTQDHIDTLEDN